MEAHLEVCPECRARLDQYRLIFRNLSAEDASLDAPKERIWRSLDGRTGELAFKPRRLWSRTVPVPLPAAAAAAAVLVFALVMLFTGRPFAKVQDTSVAAASMGVDLQGIPASDFTGMLQYLSSEDTADIVIIRLPESKSFTSLGEPTLVRAADYVRRSDSR
jgi:anti-sigma factor RsiW